MASIKQLLSLALLSIPVLADSFAPRTCDRVPQLELRRLDYDSSHTYSTPSHLATAKATIAFQLSASSGDYDLDCTATSVNYGIYFDGSQSYACTKQDSWEQPFWANFTFNKPANAVDIVAGWGCFNPATRAL
jgi:Alternaria alternata allergen 1